MTRIRTLGKGNVRVFECLLKAFPGRPQKPLWLLYPLINWNRRTIRRLFRSEWCGEFLSALSPSPAGHRASSTGAADSGWCSPGPHHSTPAVRCLCPGSSRTPRLPAAVSAQQHGQLRSVCHGRRDGCGRTVHVHTLAGLVSGLDSLRPAVLGGVASAPADSSDGGNPAVADTTPDPGPMGSVIRRRMAGRRCPTLGERGVVGTDPFSIVDLNRHQYDGVKSPE